MTQENTAVAMTAQEKFITDDTLQKFQQLSKAGSLHLPENYSVENALKSAFLQLQDVKDRNQKPALQVCTKHSMANAMLDMALQGLNPMKKQCYFVVYGDKLQLMRSYMGTMSVTKRITGAKAITANVIYEDDEFDYEIDIHTGLKKITKHKQSFKNIDLNKIAGAYCIIMRDGYDNYVEVMNINQIRKAWAQGAAGGKSGAHQNFTDEMAKKTVIARACKLFINSSEDVDIIESFNNTKDAEDNTDSNGVVNNVAYEVSEEISQNANSKPIDIPDLDDEPIPEILANDPAEDTKPAGPGF